MVANNFSFPVYQIDFSAVAAGKRVAATKRRILWRFGFPNLAALAEGRTGTDCRGEEHEVVILWSVTSGKRQIQMDGKEVHYSSNRVGIIDFSWNMKDNHVLKVCCHASLPLSVTPGFRQYDLSIDGQSFFNMPKVYELGVKGGAADDNRIPGHPRSYAVSPRSVYSEAGYPGGGFRTSNPSARPPRTTAEEDEELRQAIQASLVESKNHLGEQTPSVLTADDAQAEDLLNFGGNPEPPASGYAPAPPPPGPAFGAPPPQSPYGYGAPPPPPRGYGAPQQHVQPQQLGYGAPPPGTQMLALPSTAPVPAPPTPSFAQHAPPQQQFSPAAPTPPQYGGPPPTPPSNQFAPPPHQQNFAPQTPNQFAPAPTYGGDAYGGHTLGDPFAPKPPTTSDVANNILQAYGDAGAGTPRQYQPGQPFPGDAHSETENQNNVALSMNGLTITEGNGEDGAAVNPFEAAMKKLVNIDNIDEPAEEQMKLTLKKQEEEKSRATKSKPIPPAASRLVGSGATLSQISQVKGSTAPKVEGIMTPPAGLFHGNNSSALVVHGQGPPPLQPAGFGVVHMQGQYGQAYR